MPSDTIELLATWRAAQQVQDDHADDDPGWATRDHAVGLARAAYLESVQAGAARYSFASGSRTVIAELQSVREAEERLAGASPNTPEYREATKDIQLRTDRIATRTVEDKAQAENTGAALRRVMDKAMEPSSN
jgi:hypothetical protein